jgi:hypothetical protein
MILPHTDLEGYVQSAKLFLSFIVGVSIFGASTLTIIVSEIADPTKLSTNAQFEEKTVRTFLGTSWILFVAQEKYNREMISATELHATATHPTPLVYATMTREREKRNNNQRLNYKY